MVVRGVVTICGALAVLMAPEALAVTGPATIQITDVQTSFRAVDQGRRGRGAGDLEIIGQALYNRRVTAKSIGHANMLCTMLGDDSRSCMATFVLPEGRIMTSGVIGSRLICELAIVGGTELYDNARGSLVGTTIAMKPRRELLVFRLAG